MTFISFDGGVTIDFIVLDSIWMTDPDVRAVENGLMSKLLAVNCETPLGGKDPTATAAGGFNECIDHYADFHEEAPH